MKMKNPEDFFLAFIWLTRLESMQGDYMRSVTLTILLLIVPAFAQGGIDADQKLDSGYILKDINIPAGSDRANVHVNTVINSSPKSVWAALVDIGSWPRWLPMTKTAEFLSDGAAKLVTPDIAKDRAKVLEISSRYPLGKSSDTGAGHWQRVAYEEYDLPWPIKNEWVVRRYNYNEENDLFRASWRRIDSTRSEDDGFWEVRPWKNGRTYLTYCYRVKPKENVPEIVFKTAVSMTVNSMIKALRHEAARLETGMAKLK